jgi:hypothetical protein
MIAWASSLIGDLEEADRITGGAMSSLQPGQAHSVALHTGAWRLYTLMLRGRWDPALALGDRLMQMWVEAGRISAGYAMRGFFAALDVARARQDSMMFEKMKEVLETIAHAFEAQGRRDYGERTRIYLAADVESLRRAVEEYQLASLGTERLERLLALLADRAGAPADPTLDRVIEFAASAGFRITEAQARRVRGIAAADVVELSRALAVFEETGAVPYAARARIERARLTGDAHELDAGIGVLEALGDFEYLARVEQYARRRG